MAIRVTRQVAESPTIETQTHQRDHQKHPNQKMIRELRLNMSGLDPAKLATYTFSEVRSRYPGAKHDIEVFDENGVLAFLGRSFHGSFSGYWRPDYGQFQLTTSNSVPSQRGALLSRNA